MNEVEKKLEAAIQKWQEQQQQFARRFSAEVIKSADFKKERLRQLMIIEVKYRKVISPDAPLIRLLRIERRQMERAIYPKLFSRILYRLLNGLRMARFMRNTVKKEDQDLRQVQRAMEAHGFSSLATKANVLKNGLNGFSYAAHAGQDKMIEYELLFSKNEGQIRFDGYKATFSDQASQIKRGHTFKAESDTPITAPIALALLSGRAVKAQHGEWLQMDFNDKDATGNYPLIRVNGEQVDAAIKREIATLRLKRFDRRARSDG